MNFGSQLKKIRKDKGFTQEELAKIIDTSRSNIANYENNNNMPSVDILKKLSSALNVSIDCLLGNTTIKNNIEKNLSTHQLPLNELKEFVNIYISMLKGENKSFDFDKDYFYHITECIDNEVINNCGLNWVDEKIIKEDSFSFSINDILDDNNSKITRSMLIEILESLDYKKIENNILMNNKKYYNCPVYGQISAGQPNWAEECLEGYLPLDPELMGIVDPEEHFFLKVKGQSMNKVVKDGAFALIHKQDYVDNGEIAVVLVNGDNATLKRFSKQGDIIVLTPESTDETIKQQIYTKDTPIQVIGRYVGKMEFNK